MDEWISIEEKLPGNELVLVKDDEEKIAVGSYEIRHDGPEWRIGNDEISWDYQYNLDYCVAYWKPIE